MWSAIKFKGRLRKQTSDEEELFERTVSLSVCKESIEERNTGKDMTEAIEKVAEVEKRFTSKMTVDGHKCSITD